ncbi:hypothetical protein [Eggerthella sinensis]|uniref:hypothetical protein n=1 Tax=Eggerthella sinensis TaxID=242230 RepID=UPI0022E56C84|nr:hypothetical protein [Eggerthella sinensis]
MAATAAVARLNCTSATLPPSMSACTNRPMSSMRQMFATSATHCSTTLATTYLRAAGTMPARRLLNIP